MTYLQPSILPLSSRHHSMFTSAPPDHTSPDLYAGALSFSSSEFPASLYRSSCALFSASYISVVTSMSSA
eukprot:scaffold52117_cov55-Cyclotella_meneghiniana.AAC.3